MYTFTMSMGAYDEAEHERREAKHSVDVSADDDERAAYDGDVEFTTDESTEELLAQFKAMSD